MACASTSSSPVRRMGRWCSCRTASLRAPGRGAISSPCSPTPAGTSSRPPEVDAYGTDSLSADLIALLDETGQEQAVFVGHDWGALIVWDLVRLHPDRVRAVVGVSVPFIDWPAPPTEIFRSRFGDRFF